LHDTFNELHAMSSGRGVFDWHCNACRVQLVSLYISAPASIPSVQMPGVLRMLSMKRKCIKQNWIFQYSEGSDCSYIKKQNGKDVPVTGWEAYRVVRRREHYIFYTIGSQMAVRLSCALVVRYSLETFSIFGTNFCYRLTQSQSFGAAWSIR
jgi:hypothetical protein